MKKINVVNKNEILKLLDNKFKIENIKFIVSFDFEHGYSEMRYVLTTLNDIKYISKDFSGSYESSIVFLANEKCLFLKNEEFDNGKSSFKVHNNDFISTDFLFYNKDYIIINDDLRKWLEFNLPQIDIESLISCVDLDGYIEYNGVKFYETFINENLSKIKDEQFKEFLFSILSEKCGLKYDI